MSPIQRRRSSIHLPPLERSFVVRHRKTFYENVMQDMLTAGMHESFTELLGLVDTQKARRMAAGPESEEWTHPQLIEQPDKISQLSEELIIVETARLSEDIETMYNAYHRLSDVFKVDPNDEWILLHFLHRCVNLTHMIVSHLEWCRNKRADDENVANRYCKAQQLASEALFHMARHFYHVGRYLEAVKYFRQVYENTKNVAWLVPSNSNSKDQNPNYSVHDLLKNLGLKSKKSETQRPLLHSATAELLADCLLNIVSQSEANTNSTEVEICLQMLSEARDLAMQVKNNKLEARFNELAGGLFIKLKRPEAALLHMQNFHELTSELGDMSMELRANQELAKQNERMGHLDECIQFLLNLRRLAFSCNDIGGLVHAEFSLSRAYAKKDFSESKAKYHCAEAIRLGQDLGDKDIKRELGAWYAICHAHCMLPDYLSLIKNESGDSLRSLLSWKSSREPIGTQSSKTQKINE